MGQACLAPGEAKNTYGTGCFLLMHTGTVPVPSRHGLVTTVAHQLGDAPATYALEGSVAVAGALVQWLRDNLRLIRTSGRDRGTRGLGARQRRRVFRPRVFRAVRAVLARRRARHHRRFDRLRLRRTYRARGVGGRRVSDLDVVRAMEQDSGIPMRSLRVDGGMIVNQMLMRFQADMLDVPVVRPRVLETTALGAAYAAGLAVGYWNGLDDLRANWAVAETWTPAMDAARRDALAASWAKAVERSMGWT